MEVDDKEGSFKKRQNKALYTGGQRFRTSTIHLISGSSGSGARRPIAQFLDR